MTNCRAYFKKATFNYKDKLGLTYTRGATPTKEEVTIVKNYYTAEELAQLNALVEQYLIFATEQARRRVPMTITGLTVKAVLDENHYEKGIKISDEELDAVKLEKDAFHGEWNYRIYP